MQNQTTIKTPFYIQGREPMGNKRIKLLFNPASEDTGIAFNSPSGHISSTLDNVRPRTSIFDLSRTLTLSNNIHKILLPEHIIGTALGMGLNNVLIDIKTTESKSYKTLKHIFRSQNTYTIPYFGRKLYEALEKNLIEQNKRRNLITLEEKIESDKLSITPIDEEGIIFDILINYKLRKGERLTQSLSTKVTPELIKNISTSRSFCNVPSWSPKFLTKFISRFFYLSQGFGNGNEEDNVFYPVKSINDWYAQERMSNEILLHSILDKLGELSLLPGIPTKIKVTSRGAGHEHTINFLRKHQNNFIPK